VKGSIGHFRCSPRWSKVKGFPKIGFLSIRKVLESLVSFWRSCLCGIFMSMPVDIVILRMPPPPPQKKKDHLWGSTKLNSVVDRRWRAVPLKLVTLSCGGRGELFSHRQQEKAVWLHYLKNLMVSLVTLKIICLLVWYPYFLFYHRVSIFFG